MKTVRPTWQQSDCPPWCEREHLQSDHIEDRYHFGQSVLVPVIRLVQHIPDAAPLRSELIADEVVVVLHLREKHPTLWIGLTEDARVSLEVSCESAERLAEAIAVTLASVR